MAGQTFAAYTQCSCSCSQLFRYNPVSEPHEGIVQAWTYHTQVQVVLATILHGICHELGTLSSARFTSKHVKRRVHQGNLNDKNSHLDEHVHITRHKPSSQVLSSSAPRPSGPSPHLSSTDINTVMGGPIEGAGLKVSMIHTAAALEVDAGLFCPLMVLLHDTALAIRRVHLEARILRSVGEIVRPKFGLEGRSELYRTRTWQALTSWVRGWELHCSSRLYLHSKSCHEAKGRPVPVEVIGSH
eukprot:760579-Hanusia_phi.AAC.2